MNLYSNEALIPARSVVQVLGEGAAANAYVLTLGLCFHSIFEGLAIALADGESGG